MPGHTLASDGINILLRPSEAVPWGRRQNVLDAGRDATIILPTLNEVDNIVHMLDALTGLYPDQMVLVIDDDSEDGTADAVKGWDGVGQVSLIVRERSDRGLSASIYDGMMASETRFFIVMDSDFQHPPERVAALLDELREGADLVIGARNDRSALTPFRRFSSSVAHILAHYHLFLNSQPSSRDIMTGFFGGRTDVFQTVLRENQDRLERQGFKALFDLLRFCPPDIDVREVDFVFHPRKAGESKITPLVIISILRQCGRGGVIAAGILSRTLGK